MDALGTVITASSPAGNRRAGSDLQWDGRLPSPEGSDMGTTTYRSLYACFVGLCLFSLALLGSPGCGCGSDTIPPPGQEEPDLCCCNFQFTSLLTGVAPEDVLIEAVNPDPSLEIEINPDVLPNVVAGQAQAFQICVRDDHTIGATVTLRFVTVNTNVELGTADLVYGTRCIPTWTTTPDITLTSDDCGVDPCCCDFTYIALFDNAQGNVSIEIVNADASLSPTVTPATMPGVVQGQVPGNFTLCVNDNHALGASTTLRFSNAGGEIGTATFVYNQRCMPTWTLAFPPVAGPSFALVSDDCADDCCCGMAWIPNNDALNNTPVTIAISNQSLGLGATITPTNTTATFDQLTNFTVCVNENHPLTATLTIEIRDTGNNDLYSTIALDYGVQCTPILLTPGGVNGQLVIDQDCDPATPLQCCCDLIWNPDDNIGTPRNVRLQLSNEPPSIQPSAVTPAIQPGVEFGSPAVFQFCFNADHTLPTGNFLVEFIDADSGQLYARATVTMGFFRCQIRVIDDPENIGDVSTACQ